jgi:hypothetical protein
MDQADLTDEQCQRLREALAPHVAWLRRLHQRMDRRRWWRDDPLTGRCSPPAARPSGLTCC